MDEILSSIVSEWPIRFMPYILVFPKLQPWVIGLSLFNYIFYVHLKNRLLMHFYCLLCYVELGDLISLTTDEFLTKGVCKY